MNVLKYLNIVQQQKSIRGRSAALNPAGKLEKIAIKSDPERDSAKDPLLKAGFLKKPAKSKISQRRADETQLTFFDGVNVFFRSR